jgi:hypothetical protein
VTGDLHKLLGVVRWEAARRIPRGRGEAFEIAGQGHVRACRPGRGKDRRGIIERVEQSRHSLMVVEGGAGVEDGREVPLQPPHLRLRDDQPRQLQARIGDVRAEHALRDDLGSDNHLLPAPRPFQHGEDPMKRIQATRRLPVARGDLHEPLAAEPELQLHGETSPLLGNHRAGRKADGDADLRPEIARLEVVRLALSGDEPPRLYVALVGVSPEPQFLDATGVTLQTVSLGGVHPSPSARRRQPQILAALPRSGFSHRGKHGAAAFILSPSGREKRSVF